MTINRVDYLQNLGTVYTAEETRRFLKLLGNRRAGVNVSGDLAVSQNGTPNLSVNIAAGEALVNGSETVTQGAYYLYNDAVLNRTIAASDPTNPRNDLVCLRVRDQVYSGTNNDGDVVVVTGTPAPSPVDPTPPANSLTLARVVVGAGVTSIVNANITDLRTWQSDKLVPGLSGFVLRNSADSANNLNVSDAGIATLRNALLIPPSAGGSLPPSSYGSVPVKIAETTLGSSSSPIVFSSIPQGFRHLLLIGHARSDFAGVFADCSIQFNGDTGSNYAWMEFYGKNSGTGSARFSGTAITIIQVPGASGAVFSSVSAAGPFMILLPDYTDTGLLRSIFSLGFNPADNTSANSAIISRAGFWAFGNALTSLSLNAGGGSFVANSRFSLYGIP